MALTLYGGSEGFRVQKVLAAAALAGVEIEVPPFKFGVDNKTDEFKKKNPLGKIPALDTPQGPLFESSAILRYIARSRPASGLYGGSVYESALVDQWLDFTQNEIEPYRGIWLYPISGHLAFNPKAYAEAKGAISAQLAILNAHLTHNTFLVGNSITIADISLAAALVQLYKDVFAPEFLAPLVSVTRWFNTIVNQAEVSKVFGKVEFAKAEKLAVGADKAAKGAEKGKGGDKKEKGEKKEEPKKKDEPKKEKAAKEEDGGDDDEDKPKPKPKSPLDLLPATPLVLDTVKRAMYMQRPIVKEFFDEGSAFWTGSGEHKAEAQFDPSGWSFWTAFYKYNNENTVMYMTSNLVSGFIQRSDACRKYAFGVMNITGNKDEETPPFKVSGCWFFRGQEFLPPMKEENPDSEYYEWKKLDPANKPEDRATIKKFFIADELDGEAVLERKFFK